MYAFITKDFKVNNQRVGKGEKVAILPVVGIERVDLVEIVGVNFKFKTTQSLANKLIS